MIFRKETEFLSQFDAFFNILGGYKVNSYFSAGLESIKKSTIMKPKQGNTTVDKKTLVAQI